MTKTDKEFFNSLLELIAKLLDAKGYPDAAAIVRDNMIK